ncbi:uncharacterized protein LOC142984282 isoform X2 [Anticarsia gemmatalis]|uniref:uncharacterized protein LOC142984282 isoform X2 n=1 Tax=Anticarsia gemmatalis TaxID=129554 RepID=UPI003F763BB3
MFLFGLIILVLCSQSLGKILQENSVEEEPLNEVPYNDISVSPRPDCPNAKRTTPRCPSGCKITSAYFDHRCLLCYYKESDVTTRAPHPGVSQANEGQV